MTNRQNIPRSIPNAAQQEMAQRAHQNRVNQRIQELAMESQPATCPVCSGTVFSRGVIIRKVSKEKLNLSNIGVFSHDVIAEFPAVYCVKCGTVLTF